MKINVIGGEMDKREIDKYISYVRKKHCGRPLKELEITIDGEFIGLKVIFADTDFQRAFRSADYLVNDINKMNDAKLSEHFEKKRHSVEEK